MHARFLWMGYALTVFALLVGCASNVANVPKASLARGPEAGKALVYFVRPPYVGGGAGYDGQQAPLYDNDVYIGSLKGGTHLALQAAPGKHLFFALHDSIVLDNPDFVIADLAAGKTYYIRVGAQGPTSVRFSLEADNGQFRLEDTKRYLATTNEVTVNDRGRIWGEQHAPQAQRIKTRYFPRFEARVSADKRLADKYVLAPESGR